MKSNISVREALQWGSEKLNKAGVETPVLDAEVLLVHAVSPSPVLSDILSRGERSEVRGRAGLYAYPEMCLHVNTLIKYKKMIARRARREPVAYIVGHKEFYGLDFLVDKNVLVPRPETELIVQCAIEEMQNAELRMKNVVVVDVGTGSGAIAVAIADKCRMQNVECRIIATDISPAALRVARKNARRHGVADRIKFFEGNLLESVLKNVELRMQNEEWLIVANLPYLPTSEWREAMPEVRKWESRGALDGGRDGLKYYREMFEQLHRWLHNSPQPSLNLREGGRSVPPLRLRGGEGTLRMTMLCEICPEQAGIFKKMVRGFFPRAKFEVIKDLVGRKRVVKVIL